MSKSEEQIGYECPSCHSNVPFFIASNKRTPVVKCPNCGTIIKKPEVRDAEVKVVPRPIYDKAGKVPLEDLLREIDEWEVKEEAEVMEESIPPKNETPTKNIRDELFEHPKEPCEVLHEILEAYGLSKTFTEWMVRRCTRVGYLHPLELYHFMRTMRSGVKTEQEAAFIAEEYAQALAAEMQKAQKLNITYPIPNLTIPPTKLNVEPGVANKLIQIMPVQQVQNQTAMSYGYGQPQSNYQGRGQPNVTQPAYQVPHQSISPRDMIELFKVAQSTATEQTKLMVQNLENKIDTTIQQAMSPIARALEMLSEALKQPKSSGLDPEIVKVLLQSKESSAKAEAEANYYKSMLEMVTKQHEEEKKILLKALEEREKKLEDLQKTMYELISKMQKPVGEFKTDEAKLIANALNSLADVGNKVVDALVNRKPLETIMKTLPSLMTQQKITQKGKTEENIVKELEEAGLVEE